MKTKSCIMAAQQWLRPRRGARMSYAHVNMWHNFLYYWRFMAIQVVGTCSVSNVRAALRCMYIGDHFGCGPSAGLSPATGVASSRGGMDGGLFSAAPSAREWDERASRELF